MALKVCRDTPSKPFLLVNPLLDSVLRLRRRGTLEFRAGVDDSVGTLLTSADHLAFFMEQPAATHWARLPPIANAILLRQLRPLRLA